MERDFQVLGVHAGFLEARHLALQLGRVLGGRIEIASVVAARLQLELDVELVVLDLVVDVTRLVVLVDRAVLEHPDGGVLLVEPAGALGSDHLRGAQLGLVQDEDVAHQAGLVVDFLDVEVALVRALEEDVGLDQGLGDLGLEFALQFTDLLIREGNDLLVEEVVADADQDGACEDRRDDPPEGDARAAQGDDLEVLGHAPDAQERGEEVRHGEGQDDDRGKRVEEKLGDGADRRACHEDQIGELVEFHREHDQDEPDHAESEGAKEFPDDVTIQDSHQTAHSTTSLPPEA
ncbi:hypothetical protein D3C87_947070 [compost metagenome]